MSSFASHDALSLEALPAHDDALSGDTITTLSLNYKWRLFISAAIEEYLENHKEDDLSLDNQDLLMQLFQDFYD